MSSSFDVPTPPCVFSAKLREFYDSYPYPEALNNELWATLVNIMKSKAVDDINEREDLVSGDVYISYGFRYGVRGTMPSLAVDGELPIDAWLQVWGNNEGHAIFCLNIFLDGLRRFIDEFKRDHPLFSYTDTRVALEVSRRVVLIDILLWNHQDFVM